MILDGEAVVLDEMGRSDFGALQRALGRKPSLHDPREVLFFAFDLLYLDGHDLRRQPLRDRRRLLEQIVAGREGVIRRSKQTAKSSTELPASMASREPSPNTGKRPITAAVATGITCNRRDSFVIVGYEPSTVPRAIGRLLLTALKKDRLRLRRRLRHWFEQSRIGQAA